MEIPVSPLAPPGFPDLPEIPGVKLATAAAGIRYVGRTDVLLATFAEGTTVGGVLTRSKCASAPVEWHRHRSGCRIGVRPLDIHPEGPAA